MLPLVYQELRRLAAARLAALPPGQTIQPTALVHEAYMKLVRGHDRWDDEGHFFGAASQAMREILVDHARRRTRLKRGGGAKRQDLCDDLLGVIELEIECEDLVALDVALDDLQREHPRASDVVLMRQFGGLENACIASVLDVSVGTVERDWRFARAWLHRAIDGGAARL